MSEVDTTGQVSSPHGSGRRMAAPIGSGLAGAGLLAALALRDPHEPGSWGLCPFLLVTGQPCPACGGLRAMNDVMHGQVAAAIGSNLMAVVVLVIGLGLWLTWTVRRARGRDAPLVTSWVWPAVVGVGFVAFGVFRLTPWGAALRP